MKPTSAPRPRSTGLTRLELVVVLLLVSVLASLAAGYAYRLDVRYEKASLEYAINHLRAAVVLEYARLAMSGDLDRLPELAGADPMRFLEQPLPGYLGQRRSEAVTETGVWFFDPVQGQLIYRLRHAAAAPAGLTGTTVGMRLTLADSDAVPPPPPRLVLSTERAGAAPGRAAMARRYD